MAKNLLTISADDFEKEIHLISNNKVLVNLAYGVREFLNDNHGKLNSEQFNDLVRKESKIWRVLQERKFLDLKNGKDFQRELSRKRNRGIF